MAIAEKEPKSITILHCKLAGDGKMQMQLRGRESKLLKAASELCVFLSGAHGLEEKAGAAVDAINRLRAELGETE